MNWVKSSYSNSFSNCVEVAWRKSSFSGSGSGGDHGDCVEVQPGDGGIVMRDSKDPDGPVLTFTAAEWDAFIAGVKAHEFDRFVT